SICRPVRRRELPRRHSRTDRTELALYRHLLDGDGLNARTCVDRIHAIAPSIPTCRSTEGDILMRLAEILAEHVMCGQGRGERTAAGRGTAVTRLPTRRGDNAIASVEGVLSAVRTRGGASIEVRP